MQVRGFLSTRTGVVEEQEQRAVSQRPASVAGHVCEQGRDLVSLQVANLGKRRPLRRDRRDLLDNGHHLGHPVRDVLEEHVERCQPLVTGPRTVSTNLLEVAQEPQYAIDGEVLQHEAEHAPPLSAAMNGSSSRTVSR